MKTLISISLVILVPLFALNQVQYLPSVSLRTLDDLKPFLDGDSIEVETYIDINSELMRAMSLTDNSTLFLCVFNPELSARYSEPLVCISNLLDQQFSQLTSVDVSKYPLLTCRTS